MQKWVWQFLIVPDVKGFHQSVEACSSAAPVTVRILLKQVVNIPPGQSCESNTSILQRLLGFDSLEKVLIAWMSLQKQAYRKKDKVFLTGRPKQWNTQVLHTHTHTHTHTADVVGIAGQFPDPPDGKIQVLKGLSLLDTGNSLT